MEPSAKMSKGDDDVIIESSNSGPGTPIVSNPGTPRSLDTEQVRSTPPLRNTPPPGMRNTPPPGMRNSPQPTHHQSSASAPQSITSASAAASAQRQFAVQQQQQQQQPQSKYAQLLSVIEDMGKDIRPTYSGSRTSAERLKRGIVHARILVRECLMECERAARS